MNGSEVIVCARQTVQFNKEGWGERVGSYLKISSRLFFNPDLCASVLLMKLGGYTLKAPPAISPGLPSFKHRGYTPDRLGGPCRGG